VTPSHPHGLVRVKPFSSTHDDDMMMMMMMILITTVITITITIIIQLQNIDVAQQPARVIRCASTG
jgi:hypothetical protein